MTNDIIHNTSKRLPIVLCLDISPSMKANNRIQNLNKAIKLFYDELRRDQKVVNSVEIAIVTFSTEIEENTDFEPIDSLADKVFSTVSEGGTNLSKAVLKSIQKIDERLVELDDSGIENYLPFLVLVTDGNPDQNDDKSNLEKAIQSVHSRCETSKNSERLIAPYIIGVGEQVAEASLNRFAEKFTGKAIIIDGDASYQENLFKALFAFISKSVKNSLQGTGDLRSLYESVQKNAKKETILIHKKRKVLL